ncbi:hypothetical protein TCE0_039r13263 [Talaromyces pinophilus]|uniref:Increased recombination centers protein 6 n=1 Tax=Talaromyces pinophilus TaxID=128442 RepID=A0A6N4SLW0_TALPI|nr:hypothetical protein TCE0_039r13263 [Talaromyces pinophilus]
MPSPATAPAGQDKTSKPKLITNPLRLLILTPSDQSNQTIPVLLQSITGVPVTPPLSSSSTDEKADNQSFAGYTTHAPLQISNKYYSADVPIWVDEIPTSSSPQSPSPASTTTGEGGEIESTPEWKTTFLSAEAREVRDAIGAIILCVRNPALSISRAVPKEALEIVTATAGFSTIQTAIEEDGKDAAERTDVHTIKELVGIVSELKTKIEEERNGGEDEEGDVVGGGAEVPGILVLVDEHSSSPSSSFEKQGSGIEDDSFEVEKPFSSPWWEELLYEQGIFGMEVIQWTPSASSTTETNVPETRNIYGELEGLPRLKEVLSTHEWTASTSMGDDDDEEDEDDIVSFLNSGARSGESTGFRFEVNQLEREMMGLRFAINRGDNEDDGNDEEDADTELQVENLEALMMRMRAIKDMSSDLPESKRKAFAAKAVKDIMREF